MTKRSNRKTWTKEEELILRLYYDLLPATEIAKILGRTEWSVRHKARKLGIAKKQRGKFPKHLMKLIPHINDSYIKSRDK